MKHMLPAVFLLLTPFAVSAHNYIEVQGSGTVYVVPDEMTLNLSVEENGDNLPELRSSVDSTTRTFIAYLLDEQDIAEKHLQSWQVQVHPQFERRDGESEQTGYMVRRNIRLTLSDPTKYDDILTFALEQGIGRVHNVQYQVSDTADHYQQALQLAVSDARGKAEALATASDNKLSGVLHISEQSSGGGFARSMAMDSAEVSQPGQQEINARVTIRYGLITINTMAD